ncbi:MAG: pyridoxamine 5'-phosphate oxidase family protein [Desulfuromonadaceae bacterium]|nr:pyridoxamine 5'-phosphate oxidase family protein [Desulfuromonadaceae bacterium]MDD5105989.1 pyridoxamine 5'-phosphate oxidase family protein [Desulfuromonadaceae bacterium]
MRRSELHISDRISIDSIIKRCRVCRLGMCDNGQPYIVPLSFGYDGNFLYLHAALEGKKVDILKKNSQVCFEFDILEAVTTADKACNWGMKYESVVGFGVAELLESSEAKSAALTCIMEQYSTDEWTFTEQAVAGTLVIRVTIDTISGRALR